MPLVVLAAIVGARQPGSTVKALALAAWMDAGQSPDTTLPAPAEWRRPQCVGGDDACTMQNLGAGYDAMTVREATWRSINTVDARMGCCRFAGIDGARSGTAARLPCVSAPTA